MRKQFTDLLAWQQALKVTELVYLATSTPPLARDFGLRDQLQRAATSTTSNIAEGHHRSTLAEFHHFLAVADGSAAEVRSLLHVALRIGQLSQERFDELMIEANQLSRLLTGLRRSIRVQRDKQR